MNEIIPYKCQTQAIKEVTKSLNKEERTQLIKSCGTGKSLVSMWVHEKFVSNLTESLTILFYPSLFLVNQTYNTYKDTTLLKFNPLVVCSDKAIGDNENDDIFELDINEVKYPVTTNVEEIKSYIQNKNIKDKIVFITYQSSPLIGQALNELGLKANLGIFDEAHKTATANIDSIFAYGLKDENIPIAKRLFMTATPRHIKFNNEANDEVEVFSMNNKELYGNVAYEYPMRDAIDDGIITDYKIVGILIDDKYIDSYTNELKPYNEEIINEAKIKAINEAMNKYKLSKALIFNKDINASKELEKYSNTSIFNKTIKHLDGKSKHSYRESVIQELKDNEHYVITNARLFTEGVDLPIIDMIALFRNVKSEIDIIQTVGRVQRVDKNNPNKIGYILLPIFISNLENIDEEIKTNKDFGYVFDVINSLKENDKQLRATLEHKKIHKSKTNNPNFEIDYISNESSYSDENINSINEKILHKIEAVILSKKEFKTNEQWKELFVQYIKEVGIEKLNSETIWKSFKLGVALGRIRTNYNKSTPKQQKQIREFWDCFPEKIWDNKISTWTKEQWKELYIQYIEEFGIHTLTQKTKYKNLGSKLNTIKMGYYRATPEEQKEIRNFWDCFPVSMWEKRLQSDEEKKNLFVQYDKEFGITSLTKSTIYKNQKIGTKFFDTIKSKYHKVSDDKQKEMRAFWDCFPEHMWEKQTQTYEERKELFLEFDKKFGIENISQGTKYKNLGSKLATIKSRYISSTPEEQKKMREFWDFFPERVWDIKKEPKSNKEWKELFIEFGNEVGYSKLRRRTEFKGYKIGDKLTSLKSTYQRNNLEKQKELKEYWDCFPEELWEIEKENRTNEEWKIIFNEYIALNGVTELKTITIYNDIKIGRKLEHIRKNFKKSNLIEQEKMKEFWDCFPQDIWVK